MSRPKWKAPYVDFKILEQSSTKHLNTIIISRKFKIIPKFLGLIFSVHNGKNYVELTITDDMIGCKFGEFAFTRAKFAFKKKKKK